MTVDDVTWDCDDRGNPVILGRGAFGFVYAGGLRGQPVVIKAGVLEAGEEEGWLKVAQQHKAATCPYLVAVHGVIVDCNGGCVTHSLVMERLAGTMAALLLKPDGPHYGADMMLRLQLLADVAGGLAYLHAASIIHGDVKPGNVFLTAVTRRSPYRHTFAKLADFGSSAHRRVGGKARATLVYMDPALLDGSAGITAASDVYSFGIMAWQMLSGLQPYEAEIVAAAPATVMEGVKFMATHVCGRSGKRPPVAALVECVVPPAVVALVESCWAPAQASRPTMAEVRRALLEAAAAAELPVSVAGVGPAGESGGGGGRELVDVPASAAALPNAVYAALAAATAPLAASIASAAAVRASVLSLAVHAPLAYEWDDKLELRGPTTAVWSLALLPGGRLASGDREGTVRLWDAARGGEATAVLEGHGEYVLALAMLPDGRRLAAGVSSGDGKVGAIVVWETGNVPATRSATIDCGSGVLALAVLRDGRLAAGNYDGGLWFWEVAVGTACAVAMTATLRGHTGAARALAVLPDGALASGSQDKTVRLWDVGAAECVATLAGHTESVWALVVLTDGRLASGSYDMCVRLWDVATRACVGVLEGLTKRVWSLAALPDGRLVSGSWDKTIRVWDTRPNAAAGAAGTAAAAVGGAAPVVVLEGHTNLVLALQPLPGGRLASGSCDNTGTVRLWRLPPL